MSLAWNPYAIPGIAILALSLTLAALVFRAAPGRRTNRRLALFLFLYACLWGSRYALRPLLTTPEEAFAAYSIFMVLAAIAPFMYLFIVAATLDTPLTAPLRHRWAEVALMAGVAFAAGAYLARPEMFVGAMVAPTEPLAGAASFTDGPWFTLALVATAPVLLFASIAAIHAWWRAPRGSAARGRAAGYAIAFSVHDLLFAAQIGVSVAAPEVVDLAVIGPAINYSNLWIPLVFTSLLAYAVLRWQLFDIDLKIKRGISRGTLVAAFLVAFVLVAEAAQNWLTDTQGYLVGGAAAAMLVLLVRPLERLADRLASAAMPNVTGSPEYVAYRKLQVYRATLENALEDGAINERERAMLDALARELNIRSEDARAVEAEVARA